MEKIELDSVQKYNDLYGLETLHPLVTVVDLTQATQIKMPLQAQISYGLYALYLKGGAECEIKYGRCNYDYQDGTIVAFAPGQVAQINIVQPEVRPKVYGILFHPDFIHGTALGDNIKKYGFFSYSITEALHLSEREREVVLGCLSDIQEELERSIDNHSRSIVATNIELLLNYCLRFYERQFITRQIVNGDVLQQFEKLLNDYFDSQVVDKELPKVRYFADKVHLSANYFGDLVKRQTGKSPQEYIHLKIVERAKERIVSTEMTISEIAYELGFAYPQHFHRFFKRNVGVTPSQYRLES